MGLAPGERNTVNSFYSREFEQRFYPKIRLNHKGYSFEKGYLYDNIRVPHPWPSTRKWMSVDNEYSILILQLDTEQDVETLTLPNRFYEWYVLYLLLIVGRSVMKM